MVAYQLCPFARREVEGNTVRYEVSKATQPEALLADLQHELELLVHDNRLETTLLIHPHVLQDFLDYNDFLTSADALLEALDLSGIIQIASFHPHYQFAGTSPEDAENYTNRSPYPILHLLREESVTRAIEHYPDIDAVPERNIARLNEMGSAKLAQQLAGFQS